MKNKANHYKSRNKNEKQTQCETNKNKNKDLINDIDSPKKNVGKRKQSHRDKTVDIIQSYQNEKIDLQNSSSLEQRKSHPKKKPSSKCVKRNKEKSDFLLQLNVSFDLENDEF